MSHFSCLVIGDEYERQLQPFHEFECTGINDEFVQDVDETADLLRQYQEDAEGVSFLEYVKDWHEYEAVSHDESPDVGPVEADGTHLHRYGYILLDAQGGVEKVVRRTNPNAQWDWYVVGGRWCGFFPLRDESDAQIVGRGAGAAHGLRAAPRTGDQVHKRDVDFDRARNEAAERANATFDVWERCFERHGSPRSWSDIRDEASDIEQARKTYREQPCIAAWDRTGRSHPFVNPVEEYGFNREKFIQRRRNQALIPFAVVKDGKWHERGSMGWWGVVSDERDPEEWAEQIQRLYDDLPDDTLLTLVDCHI